MYGYRQIAGHCVDCMTWEEAMEIAVIWARTGGNKQIVYGELVQHFEGDNISREHQYCYKVTGATNGNQRSKGNSRLNGRAIAALA